MTTKEQVLAVLEQQRGARVSGQALAQALHISRNAVWKAVKALQADGHAITAVTRGGYCLQAGSSALSSAGVQKFWAAPLPLTIQVQDEVTSTNDALKAQAENGAPEGTVLLAVRQTGGKGRRGRSFFSPADSGLYISLLLRPALTAAQSLFITTAAAVAASQAIEAVSRQSAGIKWVNDVYLGRKKVCGILTEASFNLESASLDYAVLGIGVNVCEPEGGFPPELTEKAGAVFAHGCCPPDMRNRLAAEILQRFWALYTRLPDKAFLEEYKRRSILQGKAVDVIHVNHSRPAVVLGIDDECRLLVEYENGERAALDSGEVSVRPV